MSKFLMLDSGAFAVWTQGAKVDLGKYIAFCNAYPEVSYYVALDVIPGSPGISHTPSSRIEESCAESWRNYRLMIKELPADKVIPVYHYKDDVKWLHKYLESGCGYIGLGGLAKADSSVRLKFLKDLRKVLFDGAGRPVVKTHGYALTSFDVMTYWEWHSVDSTSWKLTGAWGAIYVPKKRGGEWDYTVAPHVVGVSPMSPSAKVKQQHITSMSPIVRRQTMQYLEERGIPYGEWKITEVPEGYSITRGSEEVWFSKKRRQLLRHTVKGVATSFEERCKANYDYMRRVNKALPIRRIYAAGAIMPYPLEYEINYRLLSYYDMQRPSAARHMRAHCDSITSHLNRRG